MIFYEYLFHNIFVSTTSTTFDVNEFYIDENQFKFMNIELILPVWYKNLQVVFGFSIADKFKNLFSLFFFEQILVSTYNNSCILISF